MAGGPLLLLLHCGFGVANPADRSGATSKPPILAMAEELLRDMQQSVEAEELHRQGGSCYTCGSRRHYRHHEGEQLEEHHAHDHEHAEYDGHQHHLQEDGEEHRHIQHQHMHEDGTSHAHFLPIYDSIKNEQAEVLTQIERLYTEFQSRSEERRQAHEFPLVSLVENNPNSMTVMVSPKNFKPDTMIRLLYERVPTHRQPFVQHLDDPVIEYYPMIRDAQTYILSELPRGKYIVCGEAMDRNESTIIQASCFEANINRRNDNSLQNGVKAMIVIAFVVVAMVVVYAILYQVYKKTCSSRHTKQEES